MTASAEPRLHSVHNPSPFRRSVDCEQAEHCPGCQLRHSDDAFTHPWKIERVARDLRRAGLTPPSIEWLGHAPRNEYRSRAVAHATTDEDGRLRLGMRSERGTIDLAHCPVQTPECRELLAHTEQSLGTLGLTPYDPLTRTGELRHVIVEGPVEIGRRSDTSEPIHHRARITLCFGRPVSFDALAESIIPGAGGVTLLADVLPFRSPGLLRRPTVLHGSGSVDMQIGSDWLRATLPAWTPQAPHTVLKVQASILEGLRCRADSRVLEVGCGVGTNSLAMARIAESVVGVDSCRSAVDDAKYNALRAGVDNCEFRVGEASRAVPRLVTAGYRFDNVVLHAMRRPFGARAMSSIAHFRPRRIVYLGPSARSLAEDLSVCADYRLSRVGLIDQAPGTTGVLTIAVLEPIHS